MGLFVRFLFELGRNVGIDGGRSKVCMTKDLLDGFKIHAIFKEMSGNCVSKSVRSERNCNA